MSDDLIHVATIASPHGVRGQFKLNCRLESAHTLKTLPQLFDEQGNPFDIQYISLKAKLPIAASPKVQDRNEADLLKGKKLFANAADLPDIGEAEYYSHQLAGLEVRDPEQNVVGKVIADHHFGAGNILEIEFLSGKTEMLPFEDAVFPELDMKKRFIIFVEPNYL